MTITYKIFGAEGHRQRVSFQPSFVHQNKDVSIRCQCADETGTNDYVILSITSEDPQRELCAQLSDGIFENARVGKIVILEEVK